MNSTVRETLDVLLALFVVGLIILFAFTLGYMVGKEAMEKSAVKAGVAEYVITDKYNPVGDFQFKTNKNR